MTFCAMQVIDSTIQPTMAMPRTASSIQVSIPQKESTVASTAGTATIVQKYGMLLVPDDIIPEYIVASAAQNSQNIPSA